MRAAFAALLACLTSCMTPAFAERLAPTANPRDLLAVAFPAWHPPQGATPAGPHRSGIPRTPTIPRIHLPGLAWPWLPKPGEDMHTTTMNTRTVQITPLSVVRIDDSNVVLLTVAEPVGGDCHYGCIFEAGLYFFSKGSGGWRLARRIDLARELDGELPDEVVVRTWPGHGTLLSMTRERCYQDACAADLDLMGFEAGRLLYTFETSISVDSLRSEFKSGDGDDHDCTEILSNSFKPDEDLTFDFIRCHQGHGTWRIDGDGIAFTFHDAEHRVDEAGHLGRLTTSVTHARVEPRNGQLELVKGELPEYGI